MIVFNGRSSDDFHVIVEHYPPRPVPRRKTEKWAVPGRSGDVIFAQDAWENVSRNYDVYISAERPGLPRPAAWATSWLMAPNYCQLWDEYDEDTFVMALFTGGVDIQNIDNAFGRFTLSFDCWPQRFLREGAEPIVMAQGGVLVNPTVYTAEPSIFVQGSGSGVLTIGENRLSLSDCNGITLDCRDEEAYRGVLNLNTTVRGDYPRLTAGENAVSWSGGITAVEITPRWYVI